MFSKKEPEFHWMPSLYTSIYVCVHVYMYVRMCT